MLEFQSQSDWWMAVRALVYVGLLWQHIVKEHKLKAGDSLPPVLPIVIYNGDPRWNAPVDISKLIALPPSSPLWRWQPQIHYHLLDEGGFPGDELARRESLVAILFRLESCRQPDELLGVVEEVIDWFRLHSGYDTLKQVFTEIVQQATHGISNQEMPIHEDMLEVRVMLATRVQEWQRQWKAEGEAKGKAKGKAEGKAEMLLRQVNLRFGPQSSEIEDRVRTATSEQLNDWIDRFVTARELKDVFGPIAPN